MRLEKPWHVGQPVCCLYVATTSALRQGLRGFLDPDELYFQPPWQAADRGGRRGSLSRLAKGHLAVSVALRTQTLSTSHMPIYLSIHLHFSAWS